jgi:hypothetical protein
VQVELSIWLFVTAVYAIGACLGIWAAEGSLAQINQRYWQHLPRVLRCAWNFNRRYHTGVSWHRRPEVESAVILAFWVLTVELSIFDSKISLESLIVPQILFVLPVIILCLSMYFGIKIWLYRKWLPAQVSKMDAMLESEH